MKSIIDAEYPESVKQEIHRLIGENYTADMVYEWLSIEWFPEWRDTHPSWCVTKRTVQRYLRQHISERTVLSSTYIKGAMERTENHLDSLKNIERAIIRLQEIINDADDISVAELRRLLNTYISANNLHAGLLMRLGLIEEVVQKQEVTVTDKMTELKAKLDKERKETEEKALAKAVSDLDDGTV